MAVLIRWRRKGFHFVGGMAYPRFPGDEDLVTEREAKSHAILREVEILTTALPAISSCPEVADREDDTKGDPNGEPNEPYRAGDGQAIPPD
jgi:hypothetical protein